MAVTQGTHGRVSIFEDFTTMQDDSGLAMTDGLGLTFNDIRIIEISGVVTIDQDVTRGGGIATFSGAGGAGDGVVITAAPFVPADGQMWMECRFKPSVLTSLQMFVGFQETMDRDETVIPFTLNGTTLTDNATGSTWGLYYDTTATTDDWRAAAADDGTIKSVSGTLGVRANATIVADKFMVVRVEVDQSGGGRVFYGDDSVGNGGLKLVDEIPAGTLDTAAVLHPIIHLIDPGTADPLWSVDYFAAEGGRSWTN